MVLKNWQKILVVAVVGLSFVFLAGPVQARVSLTDLQNQITALQGAVTDLEADIGELEAVDTGLQAQINSLQAQIDGLQGQLDRNGKKVGPELYEVHVKTLWDVGWLSTGNFSYNENLKALTWYGGGPMILSPLTAYGVPTVQAGATRKVRLYMIYSHQWMCNGNPTVRVGSLDFEFGAHHGAQSALGAGWSNFKTAAEIAVGAPGHANAYAYLKNFWDGGSHCSNTPGASRGYISNIVAHFYDQFPSE